jgi:hypothetical protein
MNYMFKTALIGLSAVALCSVMAYQAYAAPVGLGTEDNVNGLVTTIPGTLVQVASDGESVFTPFGLAAVVSDVSDAINFQNQPFVWTIDPASFGGPTPWVVGPSGGGLGNSIYYIPAPSVPENSGEAETLGIFHSFGAPWISSVIGTYQIFEADGTLSDTINLFNDSNGAVITFQSGPAVPDVANTLSLAGLAFGAVAFFANRRRKA